jgi:LPS-assembly protein
VNPTSILRLGLLAGGVIIQIAISQSAHAQDSAANSACPGPVLAPAFRQVPARATAPMYIETYSLDASATTEAVATGDVEIRRADQFLATDTVRFQPVTRVITVPGVLHYEDTHIQLDASAATYGFIDQSGLFSDVQFSLTESSANGSAREMRREGTSSSYLEQIFYTTCPGEDPDWLLSAKELEMRHDEGIGIARGAKLTFMKIPILYVPWMSFPIDDRRKTGFLYPFAGKATDNGFEFGIPWYWNIAPNQDATLTPRYFTDRGFMLTGEYRFRTRRNGGQLNFDAMPDDDIAKRSRSHYRFRQNTSINRSWSSNVVIERVSDSGYFQDFGSNLTETSRQYLRSSASIGGGGRYWTFTMLADDFQVIDDSVSAVNEPYRRLPRAAFELERPLGRGGLKVGLDSEAVYFDRDFGVSAFRADLYPSLTWNIENSWGFLRPSAGYRYTIYNLNTVSEFVDDTPDRGLSIVSLDAGLLFERQWSNGDRQTLEPRLFYLNVPYENQDDLPEFDTADLTFGFSQLFHTNRFTGADRQGDANQLSMAVISRALEAETGRERWSVGVGQIVYFEKQRVQTGNNDITNDDLSPLLAQFNWHPLDRFTARFGVQWNWEQSELDVGMTGIDYQSDNGQRVAFEYRFLRDRVDQLDVRWFWPMNEAWTFLSRVNYSFADSDLLEAQVGVEYESCCWAFRTGFRRYLKNRDGESRDRVFLELRLKGLGSIGRRAPPLFYDPAY